MLENTFAYFEKGLDTENKWTAGLTMFIGAVLWVATVVISAYLAVHEEGNTRTNYRIVAVLTGITGVTTFFDFWFEAKWITMFTIAMGSIATFTSAGTLITVTDQNTQRLTQILGMWTLDPDDPLRWILLYVQLTANAIMLAMIFNQTRRPKLYG